MKKGNNSTDICKDTFCFVCFFPVPFLGTGTKSKYYSQLDYILKNLLACFWSYLVFTTYILVQQQLHKVAPTYVGVVFVGKLMPPPLTEILGLLTELARLTRFESRNTTATEMSSWKCRRTPRSIFFKSEYLISLFFAASCSAVFTNLLAIPCQVTKHASKFWSNC